MEQKKQKSGNQNASMNTLITQGIQNVINKSYAPPFKTF
jgi:hypothetical protein